MKGCAALKRYSIQDDRCGIHRYSAAASLPVCRDAIAINVATRHRATFEHKILQRHNSAIYHNGAARIAPVKDRRVCRINRSNREITLIQVEHWLARRRGNPCAGGDGYFVTVGGKDERIGNGFNVKARPNGNNRCASDGRCEIQHSELHCTVD
jgi:hypothetical protein